MAGGPKALWAAVEADEDSEELGVREIRKRRPSKKDVVVGIAAIVSVLSLMFGPWALN